MKLIDDLRDVLESIGATLEASDYCLNCDAPSGYVWGANGCRCIAIHYATNSQSWLAKALREDGLPRLRFGLLKVTDPEEIADHRHETGDDAWGAAPEAPATIEWPKDLGTPGSVDGGRTRAVKRPRR